MDEQRLFRCSDPSDPNRCKAVHASMPCPYLSIEGAEYCPRHAAAFNRREKKSELQNYYLTKFKARVEAKISSPRLKSLTEEVGILRLVLEEVLEGCANDFDLVLYSSKINEIITCIKSTLEASTKLEEKANLTLDKGQVTIIASRIIEIISARLDETHVKEVAEEIIKAFEVNL